MPLALAALLAGAAVAPGLLAAQDGDGGTAAPVAPEAARAAFRHLTPADGLSTESVSAVLQDRFGFVWIGTADGLDRYDGYSVREYDRGADSTTLSGSVVSALAEGADGALWVGTRRGLNRLDRATDRFQRYRARRGGLPSDDVIALHADSAGAVWAGTAAGLGRLDPASGEWTAYRHSPADSTSLPHDNVAALAPAAASGAAASGGRARGLWVGTDGGVALLDPATGRFRPYPRESETALGGAVTSLAVGERGDLWVGTFGDGLWRLDPATGAWAPVEIGGRAAGVISTVYEDRGGMLWVGTLGDGLRQVFPVGGAVAYRADDADPDALADDAVTDVMEDRQGVLWIATYSGVDRVDRARGTLTRIRHDAADAATISSNDVGALLASGGSLYVGTDRSVDVSADRRAFRRLPVAGGALALYRDREGTVWAGTEGGIARVGADGLAPLALGGTAGTPAVQSMLEDRRGRFFAGTLADGLLVVDRATGRAVALAHDPADPGAIAHDDVVALAEDARGGVWAGTQEGLCRLDEAPDPATSGGASGGGASGGGASGARGRFTCFRAAPADPDALASGAVQALHVREDGSLWVGTAGGLHRLDPDAPEQGFARYTEATTDLPSDDVMGIQEDADGFLWLSTASGLVRFDPVTGTFQQRSLGSDGAARALGGAAARAADGTLFFGGSGGVVAFAPDQLAAANPYPPQVAITEVLLAGEPLAPEAGLLDAPAPLATTLRLAHDEADWVTFAYAALHFSDPARNSYRYRMEGVHDEWRGGLGDRDRTASYNDLGPGRYTFEVQAANSDGLWSERAARLSVVVSPPWWRTPWAYLAYAALSVLALVRVDRWQRSRLLREERERAERREQEIRAETAEAEARKAEADRQRAEAEARAARAEAEGKREVEKAFRELKATQTQLVQSEKLASLGQLTAGIAHEIKNPLNFVNNFADLSVELADELGEELDANREKPVSDVLGEVRAIIDDLRDNARRIHEHGTRADRIVKAMLLHSRGASSERARVDVAAFVEEYANLAYHGARANDKTFQVELVRELDPATGEADVIPQELGRVLINLLGNAFYAVRQRRKVEGGDYAPAVSVGARPLARDGEPWVEITVGDNGTGIPAELREKVFEPFFTTKPTGEGTGLGLSLAYDIVTQGHGGTMEVESAEGEGTTFRLTLPARGAAPEAGPPEASGEA